MDKDCIEEKWNVMRKKKLVISFKLFKHQSNKLVAYNNYEYW